MQKYLVILQLLFDAGEKEQMSDCDVLTSAVYRGLSSIIEVLLKNGFNPNQRCGNGLTPIEIAEQQMHRDTIYVFHRHGVESVPEETAAHLRFIHYARDCDVVGMAKNLWTNDFINRPDKDGKTALTEAVSCAVTDANWYATVSYLLQKRANPNLQTMILASFIKPHHPFDPPEKWAKMYDPEKIEILPGWTDKCPAHDLKQAYFKNEDLTKEKLKKITTYYYVTITHIDFHIGRMIDSLKKRRMYDNTIIVFTSDHGEHMGFHHMLLKGGHAYDSIAKVPLIIKYPGSDRSGTSTDRLVSNVDIAPTILKLAGLKKPKAMQGLNLLGNKNREIVFVEDRKLYSVMARTKKTKLILQRKISEDGSINYSGLLYDLEKDPLEMNDLYGSLKYSSQQKNLTAAIDSWLQARGKRNIYGKEAKKC